MAGRRENGAGTRPKQGANGRWWQQISFTNPETDEPVRTTIRGATEGEVKQKVKEFLRAIENGVKPDEGNMLFQDWAELWLVTYKKNSVEPGTYANYKNTVLNHIKNSALGKTKLTKVKQSDIQKFVNEKAHVISPGTIGQILAVISDALKTAEIDKRIVVSPCKRIKTPKPKQKEVNPFTAEEAKKLLEAAKPGSMIHAVIFLGLHTGMRVSEIAGLRWDDVDFQAGNITLRQQVKIVPKTATEKRKAILGSLKTPSSYRTIPMKQRLADVLKSHKAKQAEEKLALGGAYEKLNLVFAWEDGTMIQGSTLSKRFTTLLEKKTDLPMRSIHSLRHTYASIGISQGLSIKTVSKILGHKNIEETLNTYGHLMPGDMDTVMDAVEVFFSC